MLDAAGASLGTSPESSEALPTKHRRGNTESHTQRCRFSTNRTSLVPCRARMVAIAAPEAPSLRGFLSQSPLERSEHRDASGCQVVLNLVFKRARVGRRSTDSERRA